MNQLRRNKKLKIQLLVMSLQSSMNFFFQFLVQHMPIKELPKELIRCLLQELIPDIRVDQEST